MAISTSDELQKQLTVIFGFNGQLGLECGAIIGVGKLSTLHQELLIKQALNFLHSYNAMLRDYAGCEMYSIEFELENMDKEAEKLKIMPKGMFFIHGEYKDCNTLLLLLTNEMSLLDTQKAKQAVDNLGEIYFEVEEALDRPELKKDQQKCILEKFAQRFAYKLEGNWLDGKWNRKLVGIKTADASENEAENYLSVHMKKNVRWDKNKEILTSGTKFTTPNLPWSENDQFEFMKHQILPSAAYVIAENTFKLTANLLQIANAGTIDDVQQQILVVYLNSYITFTKIKTKSMNFDQFYEEYSTYLTQIRDYVEVFKKIADGYCKTGENGNLTLLSNSFMKLFPPGPTIKENFLNFYAIILQNQLKDTRFHNLEKIRATEFESPIFYLYQSGLAVIKILNKTLPRYFEHYLLMTYANLFIESLKKEFQTQRKPVMALGSKYIEKFADYLANRIALLSQSPHPPQNGKNEVITQKNVLEMFKKTASELIEPFITEVEISTNDLLGFVEIMMTEMPEADPHIKKLMKFKAEIESLWGMLLRYSSINRFVKSLDPEAPLEPSDFSVKFLEFLQKRLGGFDLMWREYIYHWVEDFGMKYQQLFLADKEKKKTWSKQKIIQSFIDFMNNKVEEELSIEGFKIPLHQYIEKFAMQIQNRNLTEIIKSYEMSLEIIGQFPDFVRQLFSKSVESFQDTMKPQSSILFVGPIPSIEESLLNFNSSCKKSDAGAEGTQKEQTPPQIFKLTSPTVGKEGLFERFPLYDFIIQTEMKYFSKLVAKPVFVELWSTDKDSFKGKQLRHLLEFKYWDKFLKMYISSNYKDIKPQF